MDKEIKFCAFDKINHNIFFPTSIDFEYPDMFIFKQGDGVQTSLEIDKECCLMQYTCINDVEGKQIFSDFILEFDHGAEKNTIAQVVYEAPGFCLKIMESPFYKSGVTIQWDLSFFKNPKIIGNIHEPQNIKR